MPILSFYSECSVPSSLARLLLLTFEMSKIVLVVGATGDQGGSVARALLSSQKYRVRAFTRDPSSAKAQALAALGAELRQGDTDVVESVKRAAEGVHATFSVSNRPGDDQETFVARAVARACKEAGVQHFIWSTAADSESLSNGEFSVQHYMSKSKVDDYVASLGFKHYTFVCPPFYYSNFPKLFATEIDGVMEFSLPISPATALVAFDVNDLGKAVHNILEQPERWGKGKYFRFSPTCMPYDQYVEAFEKIIGKSANIRRVSPEKFMAQATLLSPLLQQSAIQSFKMLDKFGYYPKDVDSNNAAELVHDLVTWQQWLASNGWQES